MDGIELPSVVIDTSMAGEHVIDYVAADNAGNTATSTRTVMVDAAEASSSDESAVSLEAASSAEQAATTTPAADTATMTAQ